MARQGPQRHQDAAPQKDAPDLGDLEVGSQHVYEKTNDGNEKRNEGDHGKGYHVDGRVNCMACLVVDDDLLVPGVVVAKGVTHALTTVGAGMHHYALCDFNDDGMLLPNKYYGCRVAVDRILWTSKEQDAG